HNAYKRITQRQYNKTINANRDIPFTCQKCLRRNPTTDEHGATFVVQSSLLSEESSVNQSARDATVEIENTASADQLNQPFDLPDRPAINQGPEIVETDIGDESLSTTVMEEQTKGTDFVRGPNNHQHGPEASIDKKIRIGVKVKEEAKAQPYKSSGDIAKGARNTYASHNIPNLPLPDSLARKANRYRAKFRPAEPKDLQFDIDQIFL
ncbi:hypothetical protein DPMN_131142, partial [Dreissena polymorpha]